MMSLRSHITHFGKRVWRTCSESSPSYLKGSKEITSARANDQFSIRTLTSLPHQRDGQSQCDGHKANPTSCNVFHANKFPSLGSFSRTPLMMNISNISPSPLFMTVRHYQSVLRPRLHCKGCYYAWRHGRKFVECSDVPSHKQMKKLPTRKVWLEDYSRGDVNVAMKWNRDVKRIADRHVDKTVISHNWLVSRLGKDV